MENSGLEEGLECMLEDDDFGEEEEYDALNDETFGSDATIGDWEKDHEKLAQIAESNRTHQQNSLCKKNGINVDIESNLAHLVLDEKEGIVPRPGVWDSPPDVSPPKRQLPFPSASALSNVRTVQELEKGLVGNRPPPGLAKPTQAQLQSKLDASSIFGGLPLNDKLQINGLSSARYPPGLPVPGPHPVVLGPDVRFPMPHFVQHPRLMPNHAGTPLRYPVPPPHMMMPHAPQRQPIHNTYCGNFLQPGQPNLRPPTFLRPDHGIVTPFPNNLGNHQQQQHSFPHPANQRNQNRPFHYVEQQGNQQPFYKNNQYYHRNHDRNAQRNYPYQHHSQGMNGISNSGEYDEYAGLMSSREKRWLINIQLLQLNTNEPYVDDYYYTVFCERLNKQNANRRRNEKKQLNGNNNDQHSNNNNSSSSSSSNSSSNNNTINNNNNRSCSSSNGFYRDTREREQSHHVTIKVVYTPAQFENSLGKLQYASVTAPRKVIDMDVVSNSDPQSTAQLQQKDTKKTKQLLLEIEWLYIIQLKLEDLENPLATVVNRTENQGEENEALTARNTAPELINTIFTSLLQLSPDDKLPSLLSVRKGKTLLSRFLVHVNVIEYRKQLEELWCRIFRGLAVIGRRDSHLLTSLHNEFRRWVATEFEFNTIVRLARSLTDSVGQPMKSNSLAFALANKFGLSIIATIFEEAERLFPATEQDPSIPEWSNFVVSIVEIIGDAAPCVAPSQPIAANTLNQHLNRIPNLKRERFPVLELLLTDANPSR